MLKHLYIETLQSNTDDKMKTSHQQDYSFLLKLSFSEFKNGD